MDKLSGLKVLWFSLENIEEFISKNLNLLNNKKLHEFLIALVYSRVIKKNDGPKLCVGIAYKSQHAIDKNYKIESLNFVLENQHLFDDTDVDLYLAKNIDYESEFQKLQITRLVPNDKKIVNNDILLSLLKKKFLVQPDDKMILLISIEENILFNLDETLSFLKKQRVPYGMICLVGNISKGKNNSFNIITIYPESTESTHTFKW